jgi:hypothetical protein
MNTLQTPVLNWQGWTNQSIQSGHPFKSGEPSHLPHMRIQTPQTNEEDRGIKRKPMPQAKKPPACAGGYQDGFPVRRWWHSLCSHPEQTSLTDHT